LGHGFNRSAGRRDRRNWTRIGCVAPNTPCFSELSGATPEASIARVVAGAAFTKRIIDPSGGWWAATKSDDLDGPGL